MTAPGATDVTQFTHCTYDEQKKKKRSQSIISMALLQVSKLVNRGAVVKRKEKGNTV